MEGFYEAVANKIIVQIPQSHRLCNFTNTVAICYDKITQHSLRGPWVVIREFLYFSKFIKSNIRFYNFQSIKKC